MVMIGLIGGFLASVIPFPANLPPIIGTIGMEGLGLVTIWEEW